MQLSPILINAINDYSFLLEKGYADKRSLELVADRYQLNTNERGVLFRGVLLKEEAINRSQKMIGSLPRGNIDIKVDLLNQVYTVGSYIEGKLVFIAMDGVLRDASEKHGKLLKEESLARVLEQVVDFFDPFPGYSVDLLLDDKPDISGPLENLLQVKLHKTNVSFQLIRTDAVDAMLSSEDQSIVATSDATIIDRTNASVFDLARAILNKNFHPEIPDLHFVLP